MTLLVVVAVEAERDAVVRDLGAAEPIEIAGRHGVRVETPAGPLHAFAAGVGPVAAALTTASLLTASPRYNLVASAGIAGGFRGRVETGTIVVADRATFADLGVRADDGFLTLHDMGLRQDSTHAVASHELVRRLSLGPLRVAHGEILTLACMTGTEADADQLASRHPHALAEAMEGFGVVAAVMAQPHVPSYVTEIRAISNLIGRRDRSTWEIPRALDALASAFATLVKEPLP